MQALFTGDTLAYSRRQGALSIMRCGSLPSQHDRLGAATTPPVAALCHGPYSVVRSRTHGVLQTRTKSTNRNSECSLLLASACCCEAPVWSRSRYNWDSVDKQLGSVKALLDVEFLHIFPGHGRQHHFASLDDRLQQFDHMLVEEGAAGVL